jgi:hypothetical protein
MKRMPRMVGTARCAVRTMGPVALQPADAAARRAYRNLQPADAAVRRLYRKLLEA